MTPHGRAGGDYVRVSLPFERIARVTRTSTAPSGGSAPSPSTRTDFGSRDSRRSTTREPPWDARARCSSRNRRSTREKRVEGGGERVEGEGEEEEVEGEGERVGAAREGAARRARPKNPARRRCPRRDDKGAEVTREREFPSDTFPWKNTQLVGGLPVPVHRPEYLHRLPIIFVFPSLRVGPVPRAAAAALAGAPRRRGGARRRGTPRRAPGGVVRRRRRRRLLGFLFLLPPCRGGFLSLPLGLGRLRRRLSRDLARVPSRETRASPLA